MLADLTAPRSPRRALALALATAAVAVVLAACGGGGSSNKHASLPAPSPRASGPETIFTAGTALVQDPAGTVKELHALGVDRVRIFLHWGDIAPNGSSTHTPRFDATNPAAYPAAHWAVYDTMIQEVLSHHMGVDVVIGPNPPRWSNAKGAPDPATQPWWKPDAAEFGQFVQAVGIRYSGHYTPPGQSAPLPRVGFWSLWNEPNSGVQLAPQTTHSGSQVEVAPRYYRALADAAWTGLKRTGHGHDTTLLGELAPVGSTVGGAPGLFAVMTPLRFLRALYCVGTDYKPLSGAAATARGCPATSAASKRFAGEHPVLFHATAFAHHPYSFALSPGTKVPGKPDDADLAQIDSLFTALDKVQAAYGSHTRFPVYSTEYGYQTTPPGTQSGTLSPTKAASWLNWAEYLTWRQPRMASYDQYLLEDPPPIAGKPYKAFASGIVTYSGTRKPGWFAFRLPVWLPVTSTSKGKPLEVWGCARPARNLPAGSRPPIAIQWRPRGGGSWTTVAHAPTTHSGAYVDARTTFSGSGDVRLTWTPPHGPAMHSRTTAITIR